MADDTVDAATRTLLIEIDTCLERAFAQQGKGSGDIVELTDALIAAVRAETRPALIHARDALKANEDMTGTWELYQHSPEMKAINAAIAKADGS